MSFRSFAQMALLVSIVVISLCAGAAQAEGGPEQIFAGKILTSDKKFPSHAKSMRAYVSALRKQTKSVFWEDKAKKTWKIHFAAFFKKPLADIEVIVKLYDVAGGRRTLLANFEQFVDQRGDRSLVSQFTLERQTVGANKDVLMQVEVKGAVVATGKFKILGEHDAYSGRVDFSNEDTKGADAEE